GRVEVLAHGDAAAIDRLADWLRQGPPLARVDAVAREAADDGDAPAGFTIG
ncbi:MAG TPA: acylphosphatase, partial [Lysobacter sp.]|nr:acylphosphatase [Lysobacter sp.]